MVRWSALCDKGVFISFGYDVMMLGRQGHLRWFETDDGDALVRCLDRGDLCLCVVVPCF